MECFFIGFSVWYVHSVLFQGLSEANFTTAILLHGDDDVVWVCYICQPRLVNQA